MPLKLIPPQVGRSPNWRVRGTYLGVSVDRSTQTGERAVARKLLAVWKEDIERGRYARPGEPTFAGAALTYMQAGGERRFVEPLLRHFGERHLSLIGQGEIDAAAMALYPNASAATRNRQVYSPMSAVLKRAGVETALKRPKGGRGSRRTHWLTPDQFFALHAAAEAHSARFAALLTFLTYCGPRLSEALRLEWADVDLAAGVALLRRTKNGDPQSCHLPPAVIAALANLPQDRMRVFGLAKSGRLYALLAAAEKASGVTIPQGVAFHILRHSYGAWMRRYGGADSSALLATGRWKDRQSVEVYEHVDVTAEARRADLLPTRAKSVRKGRRHG